MKELDIKTKLERHFKDAVDFEFVIQEGKLWILNARVARRTRQANLKISIDLYTEKIINENETIEKIQLEDIKEILSPTLKNTDELKLVLKGLPASPGIATGKVSFSSQDIVNFKKNDCILFKEGDVSPEDYPAEIIAQATITTRGGMTSHAALVARGLGKCCVTGIRNLKIDCLQRIAITDNLTIKEDDWITVDGCNGNIYLGKGIFVSPNWREYKELYLLHRIIEKVICTNSADLKIIGKIWLIRDFFLHNVPFEIKSTNKKNVETKKYISFIHPTPYAIGKYCKLLTKISSDFRDIKFIIIGLRNTLLRQLGNKVGIGKHYKYYKPILDPMLCVENAKEQFIDDYYQPKEQLIAEEFFDIGKYLPNYIDIYRIRIYIQVKIEYDKELSFLDYTNKNGESVILNCNNIEKAYIEINDRAIDINELPNLYNIFRKREYFWTWYNENLTTHKEMVDFLNKPQRERINNFRLNEYAHELELLENNLLTKSGKSLIY